jgi:hypothetical protein
MAYQRADPRSFSPRGFHPLDIQHREFMARAVISRASPTHEDFAIASFFPLPGNAMHFGPVQELLHEFLEDRRRILVREIQPSHLGQALVRLDSVHDRDLLVNSSPHQYGDVQISFARHNQGRNWRALNFNRDCWLMLLGFPLDYWNLASIQNAISSFGRVILWENDQGFLTGSW